MKNDKTDKGGGGGEEDLKDNPELKEKIDQFIKDY